MLCKVILLAFVAYASAQDDGSVTAELKDQSQCNNRILASKGVKGGEKLKTKDGIEVELDRAASFYRKGGRATVVFQEDKLWLESPEGVEERVKVPGCFVLKAKDVQINRPLRTLTAEIDMRIGAIPDRTTKVKDWPKPLPCKQENINSTCSCGLSDSCFYCDFCKNLADSDITGDLTKTGDIKGGKGKGKGKGKGQDKQIAKPTQKFSVFNKEDGKWINPDECDCDIKPGLYDIQAEVCTPSGEDLSNTLPEAVIALVDENKQKAADGAPPASTEFTLYSIVTLYDDSFGKVSEWASLPKMARKGKLYQHRSKHIVGCHFVVTDVIV